MGIGKKILRWLAIFIAVLVIVVSVAGIYGGWRLHSIATTVTTKTFSVIDTPRRPSTRWAPTCRRTAPC